MLKPRTIALLILLLAALAPLRAQAQTRQLVRVAVSTATPHNTPFWVAKDKKIFDKYGIDVQMIFVAGGALAAQMLAAGVINGPAGGPAAAVERAANGGRT